MTEVVKITKERVGAGKVVSQECALAFDTMSLTLTKITESVRMIALATKEQEVGITQTKDAMIEMDKVTHRNSGQAETLSSQANSLSSESKALLASIHLLREQVFGKKR